MADGKSTKAGRNKDKCAKYRTLKTREKNKIRRVLKSSGREAAEAYARSYNMTGYLAGLLKEKGR